MPLRPMAEQLSSNLRSVRDRIESACARSGRSPESVTLIAVTKYAELDWVKCLVDLGVTDLGESRPQQLASRSQVLPPHLRWHQIGHLQRNKVELILSRAERIHSVDSLRLLEQIEKDSARQKIGVRVLLEVNVSGEESKDGFSVEALAAAWPTILEGQRIEITGLMTMAPLNDDPEVARSTFRSLRELRNRLREVSGERCRLSELSMGMSGDFEIGIEEGATHVRVGSSLFEGVAS